jgi:uncharacterized protein YbaR (Trm112 family)
MLRRDDMPLDKNLLEILCCPVTKVPVAMLPEEKLKKLNDSIQKGGVRDKEGTLLEKPVEEALITEDGKTLFTINSGIPIMLEDKGIPTEQLEGF